MRFKSIVNHDYFFYWVLILALLILPPKVWLKPTLPYKSFQEGFLLWVHYPSSTGTLLHPDHTPRPSHSRSWNPPLSNHRTFRFFFCPTTPVLLVRPLTILPSRRPSVLDPPHLGHPKRLLKVTLLLSFSTFSHSIRINKWSQISSEWTEYLLLIISYLIQVPLVNLPVGLTGPLSHYRT